MENILVEKSILQASGEINKDKINLVAGTISSFFTEMIWLSSVGDMDTINRMTDIFVKMNNPKDNERLFQIILILFGTFGIELPEEVILISHDEEALNYFLFSFILDFGEIINEYILDK